MSGIFIGVAVVSLVGAVITRYVQRNVLDTNGYLAIVGPLPQNPQVSSALAKYTTTKLFDAADAEASIKEFLPPRLAPLANPLADRLEDRVNQTSQNFIQGETFGAIWTTSNQLLQKGVVRLAESKQGEGKLAAIGSLDLSRAVSAVRERIGGEGAGLTEEQQDKAAAIKVDLKQRVERLRTTYSAINTGAYVLPYLAVALLLASLAVAYSRRRTLMAIGVTLLLLGVAMLLAFKIVSGDALGDISDSDYRSAAEVVYEAFYSDLRARLISAVVFGSALVVLALLAGPYAWAKWLRHKLGLVKAKRTEPYRLVRHIRVWLAHNEPWLALAGAAATIIWLLALSSLTAATLVVILSLLVGYVSLLHLLARPAPARATA